MKIGMKLFLVLCLIGAVLATGCVSGRITTSWSCTQEKLGQKRCSADYAYVQQCSLDSVSGEYMWTNYDTCRPGGEKKPSVCRKDFNTDNFECGGACEYTVGGKTIYMGPGQAVCDGNILVECSSSIDAAIDNNPTTTDCAAAGQTCQDGACVVCSEAIPGHNNISENRINVVFVGINYTNMPTFIPYVEDAIDYDGNNYGLLAIEPYKSNKDKFNFFYVNEMGAVDTSQLDQFQYPEGVSLEISRLGALCPITNNKNVVGLINWGFNSNPDEVSFILPPNARSFKVFVHEVGGHLIGGLNDEYLGYDLCDGNIGLGIVDQAYYSPDVNCTYYEGERRPWSCTSTPASIADCEANTPWRDLIGNSCGLDGVVDCFEIDFGNPDCLSGQCVDRYVPLVGDSSWGVEVSCNMGSTCVNYYRSTKITLMAAMWYGPFSFGASNERIICKNIKDVIGSVGGICDELCLDGCPYGQRCIQGACQTA